MKIPKEPWLGNKIYSEVGEWKLQTLSLIRISCSLLKIKSSMQSVLKQGKTLKDLRFMNKT